MMAKLGQVLLAIVMMVVFGWPAVATVRMAVRETSATVDDAARDLPSGRYLGMRPMSLAKNTIALVGLTAMMAIPPGLVLAWLLFRTDLFGRRALMMLLGLSLFVPMPLHAVAWLGSFGNAGRSQALAWVPMLSGMWGAAFVHATAALPWVVFLSGVGLLTVESELEDAARLDLSTWRVVMQISLRRALGAILGSLLILAVLTAGDMTVTDLLQIRTYAEESYIQAQLHMGTNAAAAVAAGPLILVLGGLIVWGASALLKADPARLPSGSVRARTWPLGRGRVPCGLLCLVIVGNLVALPIYGLVWRAGRVGSPPSWSVNGLVGSLQRAWPDLISPTSPGPWYIAWDSRPMIATLVWSATAATIAVMIAWPLAWLSRDRGTWRWVAAVAAALGLAAPGPVVGEALKRAYQQVPFINDTPAMLVLAYITRTLPYALLVIWPAVRTIPREHQEAAMLDGLNPWLQFLRIGFPLTRGATLAAWGVAFVLAMGELPAANFVANPGRWPVALEVWRLLHTGVESRLAGVGLILLFGVGVAGSATAFAIHRAYRV